LLQDQDQATVTQVSKHFPNKKTFCVG